MKFPKVTREAERYGLRTLPRLSMDEYVAWVDKLIQDVSPEQLARQRTLKAQIKVPFRLTTERCSRKSLSSNLE